MPSISSLRYRVATFAAILLFLSALITGGAIYHRQQQVEHKMLENLTWAAYQFDREVRELRLALHGASVSHPDDVLLRYEILVSRTGLFQQGEIRRAMQETTLTEPLQAAIQSVHDLDALLAQIEGGERLLDPQTRRELDERLVALQGITSALLIDTNAHVASLRNAERNELLSLYGVVLALIVLLMVSGSVLVVSLIREGREHGRKTRMLEHQARELDETARQAEQASRAKSEFMAVMSHEIRTPLNGVVGVADLLADEPLPAGGQRLLDSLNDSVLSLQAVINDVIDYTKYESGGLDLDPQPFGVHPFITQLTRAYQLQSEARGIAFHVIVDDEVPDCLEGDANRLRQVLMNLLNNAFKFTSEGAISLKVQLTEAGEVRFLVRDTGCGIPDERRQALFKPFSQVDSSISRRYGGSGLGLAICERLVTAMGGHIDFESHVGLGSLFWFDLPLTGASREAVERHAGLVDAETGRPATPLPRGRILVVEDHPTNRELAKAMLERLGQTVNLAENGQAALERLARESFDLVLMDMQMPVLDGLETTRRWRRQESPNDPRLPIVAMTANAMPEDQRRCREAGMDDVLCKPFTRGDLYRTLRPLLIPHEAEAGHLRADASAFGPESPPAREVALPMDGDATRAGVVDTLDTAEPLLDAATLTSLEASLGQETLSGLVERFIERLEERHSRMAESLDREDRDELGEAAHALKGAAASMGCSGLADAAAVLERQALEIDMPGLKARVEQLDRLAKITETALAEGGYLPRRQA
ncbi:ATP-binding protein [Halomonas sp. 3H]|uniref:ATP-binding protein n=1 Tax=Halomonas sp. 3H TaxID=2952527 RepID=UPI0020B7155F|nr:ATP-binding protein [Halomonas sp. 3H]